MTYRSITRALRRLSWVAIYYFLRALKLEGLLLPEMRDMRRVGPASAGPATHGTKQRVLFVTPRYWSTYAVFQLAVAQALVRRGAECTIVTCGGVQPICEIDWRDKSLVPQCRRCITSVLDLARHAGISARTVNQNVDTESLAATEKQVQAADWPTIYGFKWLGVPLGEVALRAARWKLRTNFLETHPLGRETAVDFIRSGIRWAEGMSRIITEEKPDSVVMLNGIFQPERITADLASRSGARLVFFETGRDHGSIFLSHQIPAPRYDISASWKANGDQPLSQDEAAGVADLIRRRARGENVIEKYWGDGETERAPLTRVLNIPEVSRLAVLYTNVVWDTAMQDRDVVFANMFEWVEHTVKLFAERSDWTLVIRVHPAETQLVGRQSHDRVADWIRQRFPELPANIRVVPPDQAVDSYELMRLARIGLVYASTAGLELALHGVPLVVAGDAHYRGKGFTYDPTSRADYSSTLHELLDGVRRSSDDFVTNAKKYAHLFFMRRTLPLAVVDLPTTDQPRLTYSRLDELDVGRNRTLDIICDGILTGSEFIL